jgi:hypothetical protein
MKDGLIDSMIGCKLRGITDNFSVNDHKLVFRVFIDGSIILGLMGGPIERLCLIG